MNDYKIVPYSNDPLFLVFKKINLTNAFQLGFLWFFLSFFMVVLIGYKTGTLFSLNFKVQMQKDYLNWVNMGIIGPIGFAIYYNLYSKIEKVIPELIEYGTLKTAEAVEITSDFNRQYYYKKYLFTGLAIIASLITNGFAIYNKSGCWNSLEGGITAHYFRLFVFLNMYVLFFLFFLNAS